MLFLLSITALLQGAASNALLPQGKVGWRSPDIVYKIGDLTGFTVTEKNIKDALGWIEENTCLKFTDARDAPGRAVDLPIHNINPDNECQYKNGVFEIGDCISTKYFIVHETMHFLGFYHTQNRPDQNKYIRVIPGMEKYFDYSKCEAVPVVAYDYGSGMHYELTNVIEALDKRFVRTMGQSVRFPFSDYHSINWLFDCSGKCPSQPVCLNGGYTHPRDCKKCMCNKYYTGDFCQTPRNLISLSCEGKRDHSWTRNTTDPWNFDFTLYQNVKTGKVLQDEYHNSLDDVWQIIEAPANTQIEVDLYVTSNYQRKPKLACHTLAAEINDGDLNLVGRMFCDGSDKFTAQSNKIGFHAEYRTEVQTVITVNFALKGCDTPQPPTTTSTTVKPSTTTTAPSTTTTTQKPTVPTTTTTTVKPTTTTTAPTTTTKPTVVPPTTTTTKPGEFQCDY